MKLRELLWWTGAEGQLPPWDGLIQGKTPSQWNDSMECTYRLVITSLDSEGQWPIKQSYNDTSYLSSTCKDDQQLCGRDCIIGITIFVNENKQEGGNKRQMGVKALTTIPFPYHVAYSLHISDPDNTPPYTRLTCPTQVPLTSHLGTITLDGVDTLP